jgi:hypothetical protein
VTNAIIYSSSEGGTKSLHVILHGNEDLRLGALVDCLRTLGVTSVVFPGSDYRSNNVSASHYETARIFPRGSDGGFAERFLNDRLHRS